jgi:hypothetical protein
VSQGWLYTVASSYSEPGAKNIHVENILFNSTKDVYDVEMTVRWVGKAAFLVCEPAMTRYSTVFILDSEPLKKYLKFCSTSPKDRTCDVTIEVRYRVE